MNNKLGNALILLFVISALLLMIGSVSANTDDLNNNLETSLDLDDGLSVYDNHLSNPNNKVSNQLAISNFDEETDTYESIDDLDLNSKDVVSNTEDTTINAKDSDNNIKAENEVEGPQFELNVTALNQSANMGDTVSFEVICANWGDAFSGIIPIYMQYDENELHYMGFTPGANHDAPDWYNPANYFLGPIDAEHDVWDQKLFGYDCTGIPFMTGFYLNFTVNFEAKKAGTPGNYIFVDAGNKPEAITTTKVLDTVPNIQLEAKSLNPISNIGDIISFEIYGVNAGTPISIGYIPINVLYSENELEYIGFTRGSSSGTVNDPETVPSWCDQKLFKFACDGLFDSLDSFNFTVHFKVKRSQNANPGIYITVDAANYPNSILTTSIMESNFIIENKANSTVNPGASGNVNLGGIASFEIFVRNIGGNFYDIVPIDIYFNPDELDYADYTVGVNPDATWYDASGNYLEPIVEKGHLRFGYDGSSLGSFRSNDCLNFTVNFITKKLGAVGTTAVINWTQSQNHQVSASNTTIVGQDAEFVLEYTPSSYIVNVNDPVSFDVFVTNIGGNYNHWIGIDVIFNPTELEYIDFKPNTDPDKFYTYNEFGATPNPIIYYDDNGNPMGHIYFGYQGFDMVNGDYFNFTVNFKPIKECEDGYKFMTDASIDWWQIEHHYVNDTAHVFATDADFVIDIVSTDDLLKVGDTATFEVTAHNREGTYYGSYIGFDLYFNPDELKYLDFNVNEKPNGAFNLESGGSLGQSFNDGRLFLLGAPTADDPGHLKFGFVPNRGVNTDCSFNFTVNYQVLAEGLLENNAELTWANSDDQKAYSSAAVAVGEPDIILTKTPLQEIVSVGDDVYFIIYLENTGAPISNSSNQIRVDDWYPGGELEYVDYTINSNSSRVSVSEDVRNQHIMIYQQLRNYYWNTGEYLNVTLHFVVKEKGIHCNHVFFRNYSTYGSVIVDTPELNLTKDVQDHYAEYGDLVYFDIFVENLEDSIPYFDHYNDGKGGLGVKDLVIHDYYDNGLEYVDFRVNSYDQSGTFTDRDEGNNNVSIIFVPDDTRWWPGSYINVTVIFRAVDYGNFTNHANVYWRWKDWEPIEEIDLWDDDWVIVGLPDFSLEKISNYESAKVGDLVSFTIIYTNNGTRPLTGVYITDNEYTQGLVYTDYSDKELWTFDGKDTWYYNDVLAPGDSVSLELTFKATSTGQKYNTAVAGNNELDYTLNSTDTVLIIDNETDSSDISEEDDEEEDIDDSPDDEEEDVPSIDENTVPVAKSATLPVAGNPLFVLLLALLTLCFVPLKGKK